MELNSTWNFTLSAGKFSFKTTPPRSTNVAAVFSGTSHKSRMSLEETIIQTIHFDAAFQGYGELPVDLDPFCNGDFILENLSGTLRRI